MIIPLAMDLGTPKKNTRVPSANDHEIGIRGLPFLHALLKGFEKLFFFLGGEVGEIEITDFDRLFHDFPLNAGNPPGSVFVGGEASVSPSGEPSSLFIFHHQN